MTRQSSGCRNCVERRVRCDGKKPTCRNCNKLGLKCGGSRKGALFLTHEFHPHCRPSQRDQRPQQELPEERRDSGQSTHRQLVSIGSIQGPSLLDYGGELYTSYLQRIWSPEDKIWIDYSLTDPNEYPTACLAIGALATALDGKRNRQPSIVNSAIQLYGRALAALRQTLLMQEGICIFDVLAASIALQRYEVIVYTTSTGWIQHTGGIARAIELSGPESFRIHPNRAILDANCYPIIQEAYHQRKQTFLALERWRNLRVHANDQQSHSDQLQDFYSRLAGLTEDVTSIITDPNSRSYCMILNSVNRLLTDLDMWLYHWTTNFSFQHNEIRIGKGTYSTYNDKEGPIFDSFYDYPDPMAGIGVNIYRALKLTTLEWRYKLQHPSWWAGEDHERMSEIPDIQPLAKDICRTLHAHFESEDHGQIVRGVWYLLFCSMLAYKALHRRSREAQWITATIMDFGERYGLEVAKSLTSRYSVKWNAGGNSKGAWLTADG